jgi:predicted AAA+ superfamily ATPase
MSEISRNNTGLSGEYFVAAELYRRGWSVGMTIGNAKAIDLFAEKNDKKISIQVKSLYQRKNNGWPIIKEKIKQDCYYIFVILNADKMTSPNYYICTSKEADTVCHQYKSRGVITISELKKYDYIDKWVKLEL